MTIRLSEDKELVQEIIEKLKKNGNYCPCRIEKQKKQSACVKNLENKKLVNVIVDYMLKNSF